MGVYYNTHDSDALAYFSRIEAAGSSINRTNRAAVIAFIRGCKADGIWSAIKASCLLAGPDTLAGALVPLVGAAPTNVGPFVDADYDRLSGLTSDSDTKYLKTNRFGNTDPLNNQSFSVYHPSIIGPYNQTIGAGRAIDASSIASSYSYSQSNNIDLGWTTSIGLRGINRSSSENYQRRSGGVTGVVTRTSKGRTTNEFFVFASSNGTAVNNSVTTRTPISFYHIGEALDLALLDARVSTYMSSLT